MQNGHFLTLALQVFYPIKFSAYYLECFSIKACTRSDDRLAQLHEVVLCHPYQLDSYSQDILWLVELFPDDHFEQLSEVGSIHYHPLDLNNFMSFNIISADR